MSKLELILTNDEEVVISLIKDGFCPVECSIGGKSFVDDLSMDHHGELSHLEGVAIRAYRDHYAARKDDPRFVVVGAADADACFAIASLAGLIPHPLRVVSDSLPPHIRASLTKDLTGLAETINKLDTDPIGLDLTYLDGGPLVRVWQSIRAATSHQPVGLYVGVGMWVNLTEGSPKSLAPFIEAAEAAEVSRREEAFNDLNGSENIHGVRTLYGSKTWGFDIWYGRIPQYGAPDSVEGWKSPVVVAWASHTQGITIGCPNKAVAEKLFGPGGLKNVFEKLQPEGWGGRESIGGSPRGLKMTSDQVTAAAEVIGSWIIPQEAGV